MLAVNGFRSYSQVRKMCTLTASNNTAEKKERVFKTYCTNLSISANFRSARYGRECATCSFLLYLLTTKRRAATWLISGCVLSGRVRVHCTCVSRAPLGSRESTSADVSGVRKEDAGRLLSDVLRKLMSDLKVPNGLRVLGYTPDCVPTMVAGAMPQHRLIKLSPREVYEAQMAELFENSMTIY